ncbi:MAG: DMT family transporter [Spirosomataceae bacterium]
MPYLLLLLFGLVLGTILPIQASLNAQMQKVVGSPIWSAFLSFLAGTICLFVYGIVTRLPVSQLWSARSVPWYLWLPGVIGAIYVGSVIMLIPRLGVALTFGLVIAGQLIISILLDHFGWFGVTVREVSWGRMAGAVLLLIGVWLIRKY